MPRSSIRTATHYACSRIIRMAVGICEKEIGPAALPPQQAKSGLPPQRAKTGRVGDPGLAGSCSERAPATRRPREWWGRVRPAAGTARARGPARLRSVPPGRGHFPKPTPDSAGPCRSASGHGSIRGYPRVVPPALALSVRGNLPVRRIYLHASAGEPTRVRMELGWGRGRETGGERRQTERRRFR